jgi:hypothetical protein
MKQTIFQTKNRSKVSQILLILLLTRIIHAQQF